MNPAKILIVRPRRIGDIVMTTPAVALLKRHFPAARLTYLVEEPYRKLIEGNSELDGIIAVPPKQRFAGFVRLVRRIRKESYDILLDLHGGPRASWITFLSGAKTKAGYDIRGKRFLYHIRVPRRGAGGPIHSVQNHANLVRALGAEFGDSEIPALSLPAANPEEAERVENILRQYCHPESFGGSHSPAPRKDEILRSARDDPRDRILRFAQDDNKDAKQLKLVVVHIGAGNRFRDWGAGNIAALTKLLARLPNVRSVLIGAAADLKIQDEVLAEGDAAVIPLAGRLNLIEIRELIGRAALFVGPDSGPMHIAASTETPIVAYFGPTLPAHFAPWRPGGNRTVILEKKIPCRPCKQRECETNDFRCLLTITPDEVFAACRPFLL